ncbi:hypothetical protein SAMN04487898_105169 [Pedobacter sp. ok626]|uniref:hypothetical protein n=1 Tax=Pedobacter sp. ok626 TaxID=1761882 RepID=UPI00088B17C0|nr:hypothetical protein [Pedobacter sp. ok626]SDJ96538.1 hypothetical protein SAMN04487898_105169 [Pedobacter sp. ok626]
MMGMLDQFFSLKLWFFKLLTLFLVFFEPAKESALLLLFLIVVDAATGIWIKIKSSEKINVKSFLMKVMQDVTLFFIYILTIHYFQVSYLKETFTAFKLLAGIPIIALLSQIIVNVESLTGVQIATKAKNMLNDIFNALTKKAIPKSDDSN